MGIFDDGMMDPTFSYNDIGSNNGIDLSNSGGGDLPYSGDFGGNDFSNFSDQQINDLLNMSDSDLSNWYSQNGDSFSGNSPLQNSDPVSVSDPVFADPTTGMPDLSSLSNLSMTDQQGILSKLGGILSGSQSPGSLNGSDLASLLKLAGVVTGTIGAFNGPPKVKAGATANPLFYQGFSQALNPTSYAMPKGRSLSSMTAQTSMPGTSNSDPVAALYQSVLGRKADSSGLNYWDQQLAGGASIGDIKNSFLNSPEYQGAHPTLMAKGGALRYVRGGSGGQQDNVPARLSHGEYVMDADTVSALGDGNNDAGAEKLDQFRQNIRQQKRSAPVSQIPPKAKEPIAYLKGGR